MRKSNIHCPSGNGRPEFADFQDNDSMLACVKEHSQEYDSDPFYDSDR